MGEATRDEEGGFFAAILWDECPPPCSGGDPPLTVGSWRVRSSWFGCVSGDYPISRTSRAPERLTFLVHRVCTSGIVAGRGVESRRNTRGSSSDARGYHLSEEIGDLAWRYDGGRRRRLSGLVRTETEHEHLEDAQGSSRVGLADAIWRVMLPQVSDGVVF